MSSASQGGMYLDFRETAGSPITGRVVKERKGSNFSINPTCRKLPARPGTATGSPPCPPPFAARRRRPRGQAEGQHYIEEGILWLSKQKATKETTARLTASRWVEGFTLTPKKRPGPPFRLNGRLAFS